MNIFIHRKDLRIKDNTTLLSVENAVPIFIFTPEQVINNEYKSDNFVAFMCESLEDLSNIYSENNSTLNIFLGDVIKVLSSIHKKYNINSISYNIDYSPYALSRDKRINTWAEKNNINIVSFEDGVLVNILNGNSLNKTGNPYKVFTPFLKHVKSNFEVSKVSNKRPSLDKKTLTTKYSFNDLQSLYEKPNELFVKPGYKNAIIKLNKLGDQIKYKENRDFLVYKTSNLSTYINLGVLSIRQVYNKAVTKLGINSSFITELYWRDFYINILYYFPKVLGNNFNSKFDSYRWSNNRRNFEAWKNGLTGFPIVDAAMRQLNTTGYMHNRGRMIVSSFLVKLLFIDWREGEKYFAQKLIDYSVASNNGGWQWSAGTGTDAQPFFRIFNPWEQGKKYDKDCIYIKKYVYELENINSRDIHKWYEKHSDYNTSYPAPIIDYKKSREYALEYYKNNK